MSDRVSDYAYELPPELVAQHPADVRDASRLLVVPPHGPFAHRRFRDLVDVVEPGDLLVVNESRVIPARLIGAKSTGARAEVLLLSALRPEEDPTVWEALVRPGRKLKAGHVVEIADELSVEILDVRPDGNRVVRLHSPHTIDEALRRYGSMPLPPYIDRSAVESDGERYQTVYARTAGSVAAPTAGLHFTDDLLERLETRGVERAAVTLHVGIGTFRPVEVDDPAEHRMHTERFHVPPRVVDAVERTRGRGGRVWAVGTTAVRTLEAAAVPDGTLRSGWGETDLFIRPPYPFRVVDGLITNFHLPRSTLLMLVAALAGYERTMSAYSEAVREAYRFYSYGDAMVVLPPERPDRATRR